MLLLRSHHLLLLSPRARHRTAPQPLPDASRLRPPRMSSPSSNASSSAASPAPPPPVVPKSNICFCSACGSPTKLAIPDGDEKTRAICSSCGRVHYENPKWLLAALWSMITKSSFVEERSNQPMAFGPSLLDFWRLEIGYSTDWPVELHYFPSKIKTPDFSPGTESLECALFALDDIPFDSLAFSSIIVTLRMYLEDVKDWKHQIPLLHYKQKARNGPSDLRSFDIDNHFSV
ncbi:hypothetical protein GUJ93_ZPchr0852g18738 [Zizania palustris]|uniref:Nudix hydrolase N-terminal domain-containing protein n=1 Tax=Zizania palustris TaxID=103762 RepID=A0A8J5RDR2_ZIZPA|nr:hypothetical protein GUJ93_ZPchr0852g18738 [Zizania palustris]